MYMSLGPWCPTATLHPPPRSTKASNQGIVSKTQQLSLEPMPRQKYIPRGTTSHESPTLPASASASAFGGLSPGVAAAIVISAVVGAVLVVVMLLWRWNCLYQHVEYGSSPSPVLEEEIALFAPPQEDSSIQQEKQEQQRCIAEATTDDDDSMNPHQNECSFSPPLLHTSNVLSKICYHRECIKLR